MNKKIKNTLGLFISAIIVVLLKIIEIYFGEYIALAVSFTSMFWLIFNIFIMFFLDKKSKTNFNKSIISATIENLNLEIDKFEKNNIDKEIVTITVSRHTELEALYSVFITSKDKS